MLPRVYNLVFIVYLIFIFLFRGFPFYCAIKKKKKNKKNGARSGKKETRSGERGKKKNYSTCVYVRTTHGPAVRFLRVLYDLGRTTAPASTRSRPVDDCDEWTFGTFFFSFFLFFFFLLVRAPLSFFPPVVPRGLVKRRRS